MNINPHHPDCQGNDPEHCCYCAALCRGEQEPLNYRYGGAGCYCKPGTTTTTHKEKTGMGADTGMRFQVRVCWWDGGYADTAAFGSRSDAERWGWDCVGGRLTLPSGYVRCPSGAVLLGPGEGMRTFEVRPCR